MPISKFTEQFSGEILNLLLESVANGVFITDIDSNILWVNKAFTEITGYSFKEAVGKNPRILKSEFHDEEFYKEMWETITSGEVWHKDFINKRKNNTHYFQETTITPVKNGKITHYIAIIQDVTAKKHAEKELRNSEELFRTLFYSSPLPTNIINIQNHTVMKANDEWADLLGYDIYDLVGRRLNVEGEIKPWKDQEQLKEILTRLKRGEEVPITEFQIVRKDGTVRDCLFIGRLIEYESEICVLSINVDVTKQRQIKHQLLESESKYRYLFDQMLDGVAIHEVIRDENGKVIDYKYLDTNSAFLKSTGFPKDIIGKTVKEVHPDVEQHWLDIFGQVTNDGEPVRYENTSLGKHWDVVGYKVGKDQFACIARDITEKIKNEKKLKELTRTLQEAYNDLEDFTYIASHDLKEPLRKIKIFSDLLANNTNCEQCKKCNSKKHIKYLNEASSRMINLINDLLEFSRTSRKEILKEEISIQECVSEALKTLDQKVNAKNAKIKICFPKKCKKKMHGDKTLITHVFQNLISNALKFSNKKQPKIEISCEQKNNEYIFVVKDDGIGIEEEYLNKIFDPLKRLHNQDEYPGSGIGLSICKKIIEKHRGRIWAESIVGEGSSFKFTIGEYTK